MKMKELVLNLRSALMGLATACEHVGLPWKRPDAYDEWDNCASATFEALVIEPLQSSLGGRDALVFPEYDLLLHSYRGISVIEVLPEGGDDTVHVFHALASRQEPFDGVEVRSVGRDGSPRSEGLDVIPLHRADFRVRIWRRGEWDEAVADIELERTQK